MSRFNPSAHAPVTDAKVYILKRSRPSLGQEIEAMMEEGAYPFWVDLIEAETVALEVANRTKGRVPAARTMGDALKELGAVSLGQVRFGLKMRARVWAWRNAERWAKASHDEIRPVLVQLKQPTVAA